MRTTTWMTDDQTIVEIARGIAFAALVATFTSAQRLTLASLLVDCRLPDREAVMSIKQTLRTAEELYGVDTANDIYRAAIYLNFADRG